MQFVYIALIAKRTCTFDFLLNLYIQLLIHSCVNTSFPFLLCSFVYKEKYCFGKKGNMCSYILYSILCRSQLWDFSLFSQASPTFSLGFLKIIEDELFVSRPGRKMRRKYIRKTLQSLKMQVRLKLTSFRSSIQCSLNIMISNVKFYDSADPVGHMCWFLFCRAKPCVNYTEASYQANFKPFFVLIKKETLS